MACGELQQREGTNVTRDIRKVTSHSSNPAKEQKLQTLLSQVQRVDVVKQPLMRQASLPSAIYVVLQPPEAAENVPVVKLPTAF